MNNYRNACHHHAAGASYDLLFNGSDYVDYYSGLPYMVNVECGLADITNTILITVASIGFITNLLSILATLNIPQDQTPHTKFIISLAVSDVCVALQVSISGFVTRFSHEIILSNCFWLIETVFINFALFATLLNLLVMATDHYVAILKPLHYEDIMSSFRANLIIFCVWIISTISGLLDIIVAVFTKPLHHSHGLPEEPNVCYDVTEDSFHAQTAPAFLVLIEMILLVFLYVRVFLEYKNCSRRRQFFQQSNTHNKKAIVTTGLIIGTFLICWVPVSVYWIVEYYIKDIQNRIRIILGPFSYILMVTNTICDAVIYASRIPVVRTGYRNMFRKLCRRNRNSLPHDVEIELHENRDAMEIA